MAESMEEQATTYCSNCKRDIPNQNFQMHNLHCHRNVRLCKKCQEPVPISEMEEHNEEFHAMVECKCKQMVEKSELENHEKHCTYRTVHCQYCEMDMKYIELFEHEHACGSRTEKCQDCGEFIMLKNAITHVCNPAMLDQKFGRVNDFNTDIIESNYPNKQDNYRQNTPEVPDYVLKFLGRDVRPKGAACATKESQSNYGAAIRTSRQDDSITDNFQDLGISENKSQKRTADNKAKKRSAGQDNSKNGMVIEGRRVDVNRISRPTRGAEKYQRTRLTNSNTTKVQVSENVTSIDVDEPEERSSVESSHVPGDDAHNPYVFTTEGQSIDLPCEICEALVPSDELHTHQESCLIAQQEAFKSYGTQVQRQPSEPEEVVVVDDDQDDAIDTIPCEFCRESFPAENIIMHQPYCDQNPQKHESLYHPPNESSDVWRPMMDTNADEFMDRRLQDFATEFENTTRRDVFDDPFTATSVTESFSRIRTQRHVMTDDSNQEGMDIWQHMTDDDTDITAERTGRNSRR